jgi:hypothetical protein
MTGAAANFGRRRDFLFDPIFGVQHGLSRPEVIGWTTTARRAQRRGKTAFVFRRICRAVVVLLMACILKDEVDRREKPAFIGTST